MTASQDITSSVSDEKDSRRFRATRKITVYPNSTMTPSMTTSHRKGHEPSGFQPLVAPTAHATLPHTYHHGGQRSSEFLYPYDVNPRLKTETPVIYIGVSLTRPVDCPSWGISLMKFDQCLVVEKVRQNLMHCFATWAWASTVPPRRARSSEDFRSCFGPLHATSLLQLIPGDEIVSVNGQPAVLSKVSNPFNSSRVDIVAVRRQGARRHAQNALVVRHGEDRVAEAACRPIQQHLLRRQSLPHPSCQRALFSIVRPQSFCNKQHGPDYVGSNTIKMKWTATRSEDCMSTPSRSKGRRGNDFQPPIRLGVGTNVSLCVSFMDTECFSIWLSERKDTWRQRRAKRKAEKQSPEIARLPHHAQCLGTIADVHSNQQEQWSNHDAKRRCCNISMQAADIANDLSGTNRGSIVYTCFKLQRNSVAESWGIHVSQVHPCLLGVGHINDAARSYTRWGLSTEHPISRSLLFKPEENTVKAFFGTNSRSVLSLQPGDMIIALNGRPISTFSSLTEIVNCMRRNTTLLLIGLRHKNALEVAHISSSKEGEASAVRDWSYEICSGALRQMVPLLYREPILASLIFPDSAVYAKKGTPHILPTFARKIDKNPLFRDEHGALIYFDDQTEFDFGESDKACDYLPPMPSQLFQVWLAQKKATWRKQWNVHALESDESWSDDETRCNVSSDFWTHQSYPSFQYWLAGSTSKWRQSYSWNRAKRETIEKEFEEVVHFPSNPSGREEVPLEEMRKWLRVRKQQWRFLRRKRQRRLEDQEASSASVVKSESDQEASDESSGGAQNDGQQAEQVCPIFDNLIDRRPHELLSAPRFISCRKTSGEMTIIDAVLEEQEQRQRALDAKEKPPIDIRFLFDARLGAPDDVVAHCLAFLHRSEHGKVLCLSQSTSTLMRERCEVWRQLCPSHWVLPRRPRKQWHEIYITKIREDEASSRKWSDDFIIKANNILINADSLGKIEKLVEQGERRLAGFDINYTSGVICECNSVLNLAVIYSRHKVVRWLVETKHADIETSDRGSFSPLMNAAWSGDRHLVRFLLSHGADRSKIGFAHYMGPLASPDFKGSNAEAWARTRGHPDLADLIKLGL